MTLTENYLSDDKAPKEKKENGRHNQIRVWESIMQMGGSNTPHVLFSQWEPFS